MNSKAIATILIVICGMSFGCINDTQDVTNDIVSEVEVIELEWHEYDKETGEIIVTTTEQPTETATQVETQQPTETATQVETQQPIEVATQVSTAIPEQTPTQEEIAAMIRVIMDEQDALNERQEEINVLWNGFLDILENNDKVIADIEEAELSIKERKEDIIIFEGWLSIAFEVGEKVENMKVELQTLTELYSAKYEELNDESLSEEERSVIWSDYDKLKNEADDLACTLKEHEREFSSKLDQANRYIGDSERQIEILETRITNLEGKLLTSEEISEVEQDIEDLLIVRQGVFDRCQETRDEITDIRELYNYY
jgi:hypothetical protein